MKKFILLSLLILFFHGLATSYSVSEPSSAIEWSDRKLTWQDFQGLRGDESYGDAATAIHIKAEPYYKKRKLYYSIRAWFIPTKSWYRYKSDELLAHEQLHFDLAELYARKARHKVAELQAQGEKDIDVYNSALQCILNESNDADYNYDLETLHGSLPKAQASWRFKTDVNLILLQEYKYR
jgi:hypothetical protein